MESEISNSLGAHVFLRSQEDHRPGPLVRSL